MKRSSRKSAKNRLKDKCWRLFSLYVRLKASDLNGICRCVTCGNFHHYKDMNAGHYKHNVLDFDEMNINPQCVNCNKWNSGRLDRYAEWLLDKYGKERFDELVIRAFMAKKGEFYNEDKLKELAIELTMKISELPNFNLTKEEDE